MSSAALALADTNGNHHHYLFNESAVYMQNHLRLMCSLFEDVF